MSDVKAVNVRMPIQLYERVKELADKEYISISGFIFNVLDKAIYQKGVTEVDVLEIQDTHKPKVSDIVSDALDMSEDELF